MKKIALVAVAALTLFAGGTALAADPTPRPTPIVVARPTPTPRPTPLVVGIPRPTPVVGTAQMTLPPTDTVR